MSTESQLRPSAMKAAGAYNEASQVQSAGGAVAFELLARAAEQVPLPAAGALTVIADLGSSQGRNSLAPMRIAIDTLRGRRKWDQPIAVVHADQPSNDFAALFELLERSPDSYRKAADNVHGYAIGRSFYERLFPAQSVTLAWSSYALHWLSRAPASLGDHICAWTASADLRAAFQNQAEADWQRFLEHRAHELRRGGSLVLVAPACHADGSGWEPVDIIVATEEIVVELAGDGVITREELGRMAFPAYRRNTADWQAPLRSGPLADAFELETLELIDVPDPFYAAAVADDDPDTFAAGWTAIIDTSITPTLVAGLDERPPQEIQRFERELSERLRARLAASFADGPITHPSALMTIVRR
jgi:salicylate 1-O-methyltransferase